MNLDLGPADMSFRNEVRTFLAENLPESLCHAARMTPSIFVEPDIYLQWQAILHRKGWLAYNWPKEEGGTGWTPIQRYIFERECAFAHAPHIAVQGLKLLAPVLHRFASPEQKAFFLPRILSGEHLWCQGYSEPEAGSDLASLRTRAVREGDHYVLDGTKIWTTNAHLSNWIFCLVRTDTTVKSQQGISFLLVDMATPGVSVRPIQLISGDRELNQVFFDSVRVPAANLVGAEGQGWTIAKYLLERERGGSCQAPGLLMTLSDLRKATQTLPSRRGEALCDDADFMHRLAMVELAAHGMDMFELQSIADIAAGRDAGPKTAMTGLYTAIIRQDIDRLFLEAHGPAGLGLEERRPLYEQDAPGLIGRQDGMLAMPAFLNNKAWSIMAGSNEVMRTIIARTVVNL